jgi:opacity protein-like surface antigen
MAGVLCRLVPLCIGVLTICAGGATAADLVASPAFIDPADRFEARVGAFAHGAGSVESGTADINGELVSPRIPLGIASPWNLLVPRLHVGGNANLDNRTSFVYTGLLWTWPVFDRFFVEAFVGPAFHNGELIMSPTQTTATKAGLGCPVLIHAGANIGYRFNEHWSVMATFSHLSNGKTAFGIDCGSNQAASGSNQGLNNYGARIAYTF